MIDNFFIFHDFCVIEILMVFCEVGFLIGFCFI